MMPLIIIISVILCCHVTVCKLCHRLESATSCPVICCRSRPAAMKLRLHFVVDPMGWLCIGVVTGIWLYNTLFIPQLVLLPHYNEGHIPWAIVVCEYTSTTRRTPRTM